MASYSC